MKRSLIVIILLFGIGCSSEQKEKKPHDFIEKEAFINLLIDVEFIEAYYADQKIHENIDDNHIRLLYKEVFKKHNIAKNNFESNLQYYSKSFDEFHPIMEQVIDSLDRRFSILEND